MLNLGQTTNGKLSSNKLQRVSFAKGASTNQPNGYISIVGHGHSSPWWGCVYLTAAVLLQGGPSRLGVGGAGRPVAGFTLDQAQNALNPLHAGLDPSLQHLPYTLPIRRSWWATQQNNTLQPKTAQQNTVMDEVHWDPALSAYWLHLPSPLLIRGGKKKKKALSQTIQDIYSCSTVRIWPNQVNLPPILEAVALISTRGNKFHLIV